MTYKCPLCGRDEGGQMQSHHLRPKTYRSRTTSVHDKDNKVDIHKMCHQKIHATFSEHDLFTYYHTITRLLEHEEIIKFVKWIKKKAPDFYRKNNDTSERKSKR